VTYVVPAITSTGIVGIGMVVAFSRTNRSQYVLYQLMIGVFGLAPLILYFIGLAKNLTMVLVATSLGVASFLVSVVFGDRTIKGEFKRRFHM
jgi:hypothetical protein